MSRLTCWARETLGLIQSRIATIRRPERILVVHIAKTAGTSLRRMLEDEFGPRQVYPGDLHLQNLPNGWYPLGSEMVRDFVKLPPHNVLVGHFTAAMAEMLPRPYQTATFLREPIQRSLSMIGHFSRTMKVPASALIEDAQFMEANVADYQTRVLGADRVCDPAQVHEVDDDTLGRALRRLETLDFVGLTERFADSCRIFDDRFRTRISKFVRRDNVLRPEGGELSEFIPLLKPLLERDRVLYETAVARFDAAV